MRYEFDENGVPLIEWCPPEADQLPVPNIGFTETLLAEADYKCVSEYNQSTLNNYSGVRHHELVNVINAIIPIMKEWEEQASKAGFNHSYLIYDGNSFFPCYRRPATLMEISTLKMNARHELSMNNLFEQKREQRLLGAKQLLKDELEDE